MTFLHDLVREHAAALRFVERVAHPAVFADVDEGKGVKVGVWQLIDPLVAPDS